MPLARYEPTSDIRVSATLIPKNPALTASFSIETLQHRFMWMLTNNEVALTMTTLTGDVVQHVLQEGVEFSERKPIRVECWHVDQMMALYVNGTRIAELLYNFSPEERLRLATHSDKSVPMEVLAGSSGESPSIQWQFDGSPLSITRVEVDHDLYYLSMPVPARATKNPTKPGNEALVRSGSPGFGTHPDSLAVLGNDQFMMAGDNSRYSLDSRLWGNPDEFVSAQIDDAPFVVNRKLLIGKAWGVYWLPPPLVPEFSRFRLIR